MQLTRPFIWDQMILLKLQKFLGIPVDFEKNRLFCNKKFTTKVRSLNGSCKRDKYSSHYSESKNNITEPWVNSVIFCFSHTHEYLELVPSGPVRAFSALTLLAMIFVSLSLMFASSDSKGARIPAIVFSGLVFVFSLVASILTANALDELYGVSTAIGSGGIAAIILSVISTIFLTISLVVKTPQKQAN